DDNLALSGAEGAQDASGNNVGRLTEAVGRLAVAPQQLLGGLGDAVELLQLPRQEGVVVDDLNLRLEEGVPQVGRHDVAHSVVVVVTLGMEDAKTVADCDAWSHHQE